MVAIDGEQNSNSRFSRCVTPCSGNRVIGIHRRYQNGCSSRTGSWVNRAGERLWVKNHFMTAQGIDFLTQQKVGRLPGVDGDCRFNSKIASGDRCRWAKGRLLLDSRIGAT
jgi:catalase